ncbi:centrosomal protein of 104 kDa isoform X1 [Gouania willdenowi]|nr:centrosomal protein of 104 kDa isoform X1 [Gouania willdenowi]
MPKKIKFTVVNSSSHEDNFSAKELLVHAPTVSGWRSSRLCSFPQHVTLQLEERSRVRKLQLLAHQYLIPAKVEFHIGDTLPESSSSGFPGQLRRLGYVSLSDNEKTHFKARELKSVHVDAVGKYLRITFHHNHGNRYNHYNQVALVAINVLGDSLEGNAFNTMPSREQLIEHYLKSTQLEAALETTFMGKCESISPLDDLAFDMYQDPELAHIIRQLDQKKQDMMHQEEHEQVKNLKQAIVDLQKVGERLARYEVEKKCAIEKEDYNLAKQKKEQMEEYRKSVYHQLEVYNLLDVTMMRKAADSFPAEYQHSVLPSPSHHSVPTVPLGFTVTLKKGLKSHINQKQFPVSETTPKDLHTPSVPAVVPKTDRMTSVAYDEKPLPTLQKKDRILESAHSPAEENGPKMDVQTALHSPGISRQPEPLTEEAQREAGLPIEVYGERLVAMFYSRTWGLRENALMEVCKRLLEASPTATKEELRNMIRAAVFLVKKSLQDKVTAVFHASLKLLQLILSRLIPGLGRAEVTHCLEQTCPNLLARTGSSSSRLRATVTAFIQEIAILKDVRALQIIPSELVKPFKPNFPSRSAQCRVELLEKLLPELGIGNLGFTLDNVMTFSKAALEHHASEVREPAFRIISSLYQQHRSAVLSHLPAKDATIRSNFLYKTLFNRFAKIDGTLVETKTSGRGGGQGDGQKEKEEIHSLQEQLAALKEITERDNQSTKEQMDHKEPHRVEKETHKNTEATVPTAVDDKVTGRDDVQQSVNYLDNLCIFCGKKDETFTEDGLDLHYWKYCPMLRRCTECREVVEIASITEHLLRECESRSKFSRCLRCTEAVATEDLSRHLQGPSCNAAVSGEGFNHCPLCHSNFRPGEEAWKAHLMGREGCKQNSRRTVVSQRTEPAQACPGRPVGGAKLKQSYTVEAGPKAAGKGSRIPSLAPIKR